MFSCCLRGVNGLHHLGISARQMNTGVTKGLWYPQQGYRDGQSTQFNETIERHRPIQHQSQGK